MNNEQIDAIFLDRFMALDGVSYEELLSELCISLWRKCYSLGESVFKKKATVCRWKRVSVKHLECIFCRSQGISLEARLIFSLSKLR